MKRAAALLFGAAALSAAAGDFSSVGSLAQDEFHRLSQDLGAAFSYKGVTPGAALGMLGADVSVEVTDTRVSDSSSFRQAGAGSRSELLVPKLHVQKGLPAGFDIGGFIGGAPQVGAMLAGLELSYEAVADTLATPAVGLRLSGTRAFSTGDLSVATAAFDVLVSKRLAAITPYAGAGVVRVQGSVAGAGLSDERFQRGRGFAGVDFNLVGADFALEAERMGGNTSLSAKAGIRF